MKRAFLAVVIALLGAQGFKTVPDQKVTTKTVAQCQYTLKDAQAGLKSFVQVDFVVRKESEDGNMQLGLVLLHNPKNADSTSIDAIQVVVRDKRAPGKEVVFVVSYNDGKTATTYKRVIKDDKTMTDCFTKEIEKVEQQETP